MTTIFYRLIVCICMMAGLASCHRGSYQFTAPAAYLPVSVVVSSLPVATLAKPPRLAHRAPALLPPLRFSSVALPPAPPRQLLSKPQSLKQKKILVTWRAPAHNTAGAGPYFSDINFGAILALLALYALLITALIVGAITLLVKLILHFTRGRARRAAQPPAPAHPAR